VKLRHRRTNILDQMIHRFGIGVDNLIDVRCVAL